MNFVKDKQDFINRVEQLFSEHKINWKMKKNLLANTLEETYKDTFESKSLRATSYIEALTAQILKRYYPFNDKQKQKDGSSVRYIQGRATSNIRKILKVKTKTRDTNIHHAIDAILIGMTNQSWLQKLSNTFRENLGVIDEKARENIKKDIPIFEIIIDDEVKYLEPKELVELIEDNYNFDDENSIFYKDIWGKIKSVNFWVSKKPDSSSLHEKTIYGIDKIKGKAELKKYTGYTTLRVDIIKRLKDSTKEPKSFKLGSNAQKFLDNYNKNIVEKLYIYQYNKNDKMIEIIKQKGKDIYKCLKKYENIDKKDKELFLKAQTELSEVIDKLLIDYNGKIIRRVKLVVSNKVDEPIIRGGTSISERTAIGISVSKNNKGKLDLKRIDFKNKLAKNLNTVLTKGSLNIYKNEPMVIVFKNSNKNFIANLESFNEKRGTALFFNSKFPKKVEFQPKYLLQGSGKKEFGIKSAIGIIKLNLDILGNIKSYNKIGECESELLDFIKKATKV